MSPVDFARHVPSCETAAVNARISEIKDHNVLVTSMLKEDGRLCWRINRRTSVGWSYRWYLSVCSQTRMIISQFKENAIFWDTKRLKDNSNKTKKKRAMTPLMTQFGSTMPRRGQSSARWSWRLTQSSVAASWPMTFNNLNSVQHVAGKNFAQNSCSTRDKVSTHIRGCVAPTCPWNMSRQNVPSVSHEWALNTILPLLHFAGACPSKLTPRMGSPKASREQILLEFISSAYIQRWKQTVTLRPLFFLFFWEEILW